jgi:C1A family cysteine protease
VNRSKAFALLMILMCLLMLGVPGRSFAYPMDSNETVLSQRTLSDGTLELFTKKDNEFYKKSLRIDTGNWKVDKVEKLILPKTGLRTSKLGQRKDSLLAKAIETKLGASGFNLGALPSVADYSTSNYLPPIGKQNENSCVAWSTGYYLRTYQEAKDLGWNVKQGGLPINSHIFSPGFIYNQINGGVDDGSTLNDAGNLLKTEGAATLKDFPYVSGDYLTQPSSAVKQAAYPHRIRDWGILYTALDTQDYMIQQTKQYLLTGDLPVIGVNVGFNYMFPVTYNGKSFVTMDDSKLGQHAIVVAGYDDNIDTPDGKGAFKIANSWGTGWGNGGFGYVTYPEFAKSMIASYVFTDLVNETAVGYINQVNAQVISPTQIHYSWDAPVNVEGYKVLDESSHVIANLTTNEYTETVAKPGIYTRSIQAYNSTSESNPVSVTVNTTTMTVNQLPVKIQNNVNFNISFKGSGSYNLVVKNSGGNEVYRSDNLQTSGGATTVQWIGNDSKGSPASDGQYQLNLTTGQNGNEQSIYTGTFNKQAIVAQSSAEVNRLNNQIQSVTLHLTPSTDGKVDIKVKNGSVSTSIPTNQAIKAGQPVDYTISKGLFDFNSVDLSKVSIELEVQ